MSDIKALLSERSEAADDLNGVVSKSFFGIGATKILGLTKKVAISLALLLTAIILFKVFKKNRLKTKKR